MAKSNAAKKRQPAYMDEKPQTTKREVIEREIARIVREEGTCTPERLVQVAADPKNPVHPHFEWDDDVAAHRYRLTQAVDMILASRFVYLLNEEKRGGAEVVDINAHSLRKYLPADAGKGKGFVLRTDVLEDDNHRQAFIARKKRELLSWCNSIVDVHELDEIREAIVKMVE